MKYLEKYDLYIDDDLVVYRTYSNTKVKGNPVPSCYLVQVTWTVTHSGYLYYRAYNTSSGKSHSCYLHRLIAEAFIANPECKPTVDHVNGDKTDNRISNLRWASRKEQAKNSKRRLPDTPDQELKRANAHEYWLKHKNKIREHQARYQRRLYK